MITELNRQLYVQNLILSLVDTETLKDVDIYFQQKHSHSTMHIIITDDPAMKGTRKSEALVFIFPTVFALSMRWVNLNQHLTTRCNNRFVRGISNFNGLVKFNDKATKSY